MTSPRSLSRSIGLGRAFKYESTDPDRFYDLIAADAALLISRHVELRGARVLDVGGGAGYFTKAFRAAGASCFVAEPDMAELSWRGARPDGAVLGDGYKLPWRGGVADLVVSSNVLEHVRRPEAMIDELGRVAKPGGHVWISYTNWYGPHGGHETSPWHFFGGEWALQRYEKKNGCSPKNRFGENMFALHVAPILRYARNHSDFEVVEALPRYLPEFARRVVEVPLVREFMTWNLEMLLRKRPSPT